MAHARPESISRESKDTTDGFGQVPRGVLHRRPGVCAFCSWSLRVARAFFDLPPTDARSKEATRCLCGGHCFVQSNLLTDTSSIHLVESNSVGLIHSFIYKLKCSSESLPLLLVSSFPLLAAQQGDGPSSRNCNPNRKTRVMDTADCYDQTRFETMHLCGYKIFALIQAYSARTIRKKACTMHASSTQCRPPISRHWNDGLKQTYENMQLPFN